MSKTVYKIPQPGDVGSHVKLFQQELNNHGASPRLVEDGIFGNKTRKASSVFQKSIGLYGSGIPGEKTLAGLGIEVLDEKGSITSGHDVDEGTPPWYRRMFSVCEDRKSVV